MKIVLPATGKLPWTAQRKIMEMAEESRKEFK